MTGEPKVSSIEAVIVGFTAATTFVLGFGYWQLTTRQNELEAKIEEQARKSEVARLELERRLGDRWAADALELQIVSLAAPHLARSGGSGREAEESQRIVAVASQFLASKGRPALAELAKQIREAGREPRVQLSEARSPPSTLAVPPSESRRPPSMLAVPASAAARLRSTVAVPPSSARMPSIVAPSNDRSRSIVWRQD